MTDFLLELGKNPALRSTLKSLGLSLPLPQPVRRETGPLNPRKLMGVEVVVLGRGSNACTQAVITHLRAANASVWATGAITGHTSDTQAVQTAPTEQRVDAIVLDATTIAQASDARLLYEEAQPWIGRLARAGRVVVLSRPVASATSASQAAGIAAAEGFTRSVAKEIGKFGSTANLVRVADGAESRLAPVVAFLISQRAAFITAQPIDVDSLAAALPAVPDALSLRGKRALVTGSARGIGEATARTLAALGAHVVLHDRPNDLELLHKTAAEIRGSVVTADLMDPSAIDELCDELLANGGLDIVVHNAGITRDKTLARMKAEQWDSVMRVNLEAVIQFHDALLQKGVLHDGGRVICLSSIAGIAGNMGQTAYSASKAGVAAFARAAAPLVAARGITVNAIAPGFIETRMTAAVPVAIKEFGRRLSALSQGGLPEDVANAIAFLATPAAQGVSGRVLRVCGGSLLGA